MKEKNKKQLVWLLTIIVAFLIFLAWFFSFGKNLFSPLPTSSFLPSEDLKEKMDKTKQDYEEMIFSDDNFSSDSTTSTLEILKENIRKEAEKH